ncbi:response regulator transcription factor [Caulobacter segnis]
MLMDLQMPGMDGVDAIGAIKAQAPDAPDHRPDHLCRRRARPARAEGRGPAATS